MTLKDIINILTTLDDVNIDNKKALDMEVEFCTSNRNNLTLLSVYDNDNKIIVDIGTNGE